MYLKIDRFKSTAVFTATLHVTIFFLIIFEDKNIAQSDNAFAIFHNIIILDVLAKILNTSRIIYLMSLMFISEKLEYLKLGKLRINHYFSIQIYLATILNTYYQPLYEMEVLGITRIL